jgi:hypothetical protein
MDFYHRTNYGQIEPVNKAIMIFNEYCGLFGTRDDESRYVFCNGFTCDCNNILDVPAEAISMAVCVYFFLFVNYLFSKLII